MTLHFSHIGLTDGRTFMGPFDWNPATWLWPPLRQPLPRPDRCLQQEIALERAHRGMIASAKVPTGAVPAGQAAARLPSTCQGVRTRGPSASIATVNSKWAASEPSWEKIAQ